MPRTIQPELLDCLRRPNPYTEFRIEVSEPDAVRIIRRQDEFLGTPPLVGAMVPANSLSTDARGSLILTPGTSALAAFAGEQSSYDLNGEDPTRRVKGAAWTMDAAFNRAKLKNVTARVQRAGLGLAFTLDFELQVFRVTKTPGYKEKFNAATGQTSVTAFTDYTFSPLLSPAPVIKGSSIVWDGTQKSTLNFDLTNYGLILENTPSRAAAPDQVGELPRYYFVVRVLNNPKGTGYFKWLLDTASARTIAGKGTFQRSWWARNNDQEQWVETLFADVPTFAINIETYPASGQAVYLVDVGKVPGVARGSTGRIAFDRFLPPGTTATLELSTAGSGGAWTAVKHGDAVATAQQQYWLRVTLGSDASTRATPTVAGLGIEWRIPLDVSIEATPQMPTRDVALPWPKASIAEGKLTIVRTGVRDYLDTGSVIGSTQATTKLEADIYLASRHPSVTRDKWLLLERMAVSSRMPGATSEVLTLLSFASKLKKKIPQKIESVNAVYTVTSSTTAAVGVTPALAGTSPTGNEYDGLGYYMRVRSTSNVNVAVGLVQTIAGNTGTGQLDFAPAMGSALNVGDIIEVHSGIFATQPISWTDADPADVWYQILTTYLGIAPERIGLGYLPRGGKPPRVTDIAPGDAPTQAKLKVTNKISELESADELLDQISAIVGGCTVEIAGQICFVQLLPLRNAAGVVTIPLPPVVRVFDRRDYGDSLQTPPGLEKRATVMSSTYGVPLTASAPDTYPKQTTVTVDNDALLWLTQQDLEDFGSAEVPDKIARWLYNTADAGLYLASSLTATYVRALSTGLRIFPLRSVERNPDLMPGDSIVVLTDQYTDYEPSSGTPLRGMLAVRGVIVQVGDEGRQLSIFVPGLIDNVQSARGGNAGSLTGLGDPLPAPILSGSFDSTGQLLLTSIGAPATAGQRIAVGTVEPTDAFTRAGPFIPGQNQTGLATGVTVLAGVSLWLKAFAYDAYGNESPVGRVLVTREGSGASAPPVPSIIPLNTEIDDGQWDLQFAATAGSGGGGANITYSIRQKIGFAVETVLASGNGTTLPRNLTITRHPRQDKAIRFVVTDTATGLVATATFNVPTARPEIDDTGLKFTPTVTHSGAVAINRQYAKALLSDPDTADSVIPGTLKRVPVVGASDSSGNIDLAGTGWVNKHANVLPRASGSGISVGNAIQHNTDFGHADSGMQESGGKGLNLLYAKGIPSAADSADSIQNGLTLRVIPNSIIDFSTSALKTSVDKVATIGGISAHSVARQIAMYFSETFEELPSTWLVNAVNGTPTLSLVTGGANVGLNLLQSSGAEDWRTFPQKLPFNPTKLYRIRSRFRATVNVTSGGTNTYIGLACYDASNNFIGNIYVGAVAVATTVAGGWIEQTGWFKGTGALSSHYSSDPLAPIPLLIGTTQVSPVYIFRDSAGAGGTNQLDYIQIGEQDEDLSARSYTAISAGRQVIRSIGMSDGNYAAAAVNTVGTAMHVNTFEAARSKTLTQLLAKPLVADPDTLDSSGLDGVTFRRVAAVNSSNQFTPTSSAGRSRAKVYSVGGFSIANNTVTTLSWGSEDYDIGNLHDNVTNPSRITVPADGATGPWLITAMINFSSNANGDREAFITKNGVVTSSSIVRASAALATALNLMALDNQPTPGDYYEVVVLQTSGGALAVPGGVANCNLSATHLW